MEPIIDLEVEEKALREHGLLGRGDNMGNALFALSFERLPVEAREVLFKIGNGIPLMYRDSNGRLFSYKKDGTVFGNYFGDLPSKGDYFEYTVLTPATEGHKDYTYRNGRPVRGKRRIVMRKNGMIFFTACHYERFAGGKSVQKKVDQVVNTYKLDPKWRNGFYIVTGVGPELRRKIAVKMQTHRQLLLNPGSSQS